MMMTIALRFIPTLLRELDDLIKAQRARGVDFTVRDPRRFGHALLPLVVPLFVLSFRQADDLAVAMTSRCYRGGEGRTRYREMRLGLLDGVAAVLGVAVVAIAVVRAGGGGREPHGRGEWSVACSSTGWTSQYDGTGFHGWAMQPGLGTVQGSLEAALVTRAGAPTSTDRRRADRQRRARPSAGGEPRPARRASTSMRLRGSLNALTPPGLVGAVRSRRAGFDARRDALARSYRYFITLGAGQEPLPARVTRGTSGYPLDVEAMAAAAAMVVGPHDSPPSRPPRPSTRSSRARSIVAGGGCGASSSGWR